EPEFIDGPEIEDTRVLEELSENRAHRDVFGEAGHAGTQCADAAHDDVDVPPGLRRTVDRIDDLLVDELIHLQPNVSLAGFPVRGDLPVDAFDDAVADP